MAWRYTRKAARAAASADLSHQQYSDAEFALRAVVSSAALPDVPHKSLAMGDAKGFSLPQNGSKNREKRLH